ncbi:MAG: acetoacetate decarboxylase family protein, partial [Gemmatimonadota bacterium]|nr:acetoacetate decarboxylase family protein [Gemmatimonadota bacterium]
MLDAMAFGSNLRAIFSSFQYLLFIDNPSHLVTLSSGLRVPLPLHVYSCSMTIVHGTVDLELVQKLTDGQNLEPVVLREKGAPDRAVAQLWLNQYLDTNIGPYQETMVSFSCTTPGTTPVFKYNNYLSTLKPFVDSGCLLLIPWLYLDTDYPIAVGRQVWGFPKKLGRLESEWQASRYSQETHTEDGDLVLQASIDMKLGFLAELKAIALMFRGLGIGTTLRLLTSLFNSATAITPTVLKQTHAPVKYSGLPRLFPWSAGDTLEWGEKPEFGAELSAMGFNPRAVQY